MTWYYLIREGQVINEVRTTTVYEAAKAFDNCLSQPTKSGDQIMCCAMKAYHCDGHAWRTA